MKIVMIGAGSVTFSKKLLHDLTRFSEAKNAVISLVDVDQGRLKVAEKMARMFVEKSGFDITIEATLDRRKALKGADYIITSIKVDSYKRLIPDFKIPKKYGIRQIIGDTLSIGGIFRGLRIIPAMRDICKDISEVCPDAVFMNHSNPMSIIGMYVEKEFPELNYVGLCHSVQGIVPKVSGWLDIPENEIGFRAAGINHMNFVIELERNGKDIYPELLKKVEDPEIYKQDELYFDLFKRLGYLMSAGSKHCAEYMPYYLKSDEIIEKYADILPIDRHLQTAKGKTRDYEENRKKIENGEEIDIGLARKSKEYTGKIIHAVESGEPLVIYGNVPNKGLVTNLPYDSCVEVPCVIDKSGITPCYVGDMPPQCAALNIMSINVQQLTVKAIMTGKKQYIYNAAMMDPNTISAATLDEIWKMIDELLEVNSDKLGYLK